MVLCSVADIRAVIYTSTLADADITAIVTKAYNRVLRATGATDDSNPTIQDAIEYMACALTLRRMKTTSEMAASVQTPGSRQQNTADVDIEAYEKEAKTRIDQYNTTSYSNFSSPSCHMGFEHCHHHGGH